MQHTAYDAGFVFFVSYAETLINDLWRWRFEKKAEKYLTFQLKSILKLCLTELLSVSAPLCVSAHTSFYPQVITDIYSLLLHFISAQKAQSSSGRVHLASPAACKGLRTDSHNPEITLNV